MPYPRHLMIERHQIQQQNNCQRTQGESHKGQRQSVKQRSGGSGLTYVQYGEVSCGVQIHPWLQQCLNHDVAVGVPRVHRVAGVALVYKCEPFIGVKLGKAPRSSCMSDCAHVELTFFPLLCGQQKCWCSTENLKSFHSLVWNTEPTRKREGEMLFQCNLLSHFLPNDYSNQHFLLLFTDLSSPYYVYVGK